GGRGAEHGPGAGVALPAGDQGDAAVAGPAQLAGAPVLVDGGRERFGAGDVGPALVVDLVHRPAERLVVEAGGQRHDLDVGQQHLPQPGPVEAADVEDVVPPRGILALRRREAPGPNDGRRPLVVEVDEAAEPVGAQRLGPDPHLVEEQAADAPAGDVGVDLDAGVDDARFGDGPRAGLDAAAGSHDLAGDLDHQPDPGDVVAQRHA